MGEKIKYHGFYSWKKDVVGRDVQYALIFTSLNVPHIKFHWIQWHLVREAFFYFDVWRWVSMVIFLGNDVCGNICPETKFQNHLRGCMSKNGQIIGPLNYSGFRRETSNIIFSLTYWRGKWWFTRLLFYEENKGFLRRTQ